MKTLKFAILSMFIATTLCNCSKAKVSNEEVPLYDGPITVILFYPHYLCLSFCDASGNDLTEGICCEEGKTSVSPDLYALDIYGIYKSVYPASWALDESNPVMIGFTEGKYASELGAINSYNYLRFNTQSRKWNNEGDSIPCVEKITLKLTFPHIFGNDLEHDIVTWWEPHIKNTNIASCYRIEIDGKEFTEITHTNLYSIATLVLD